MFSLYAVKFWTMGSSGFFAAHQTVPNFTVAGIIAFGLFVKVARNRSSAGKSLLTYPLAGWWTLALFAFALVSIAWTLDRDAAIAQWGKDWPYIVTMICLAPLLVTDLGDVRTAMRATLVVGVVLTPLLLFDVSWNSRAVEVASTDVSTNPLSVATYGGMIFLIAILMRQHPRKVFDYAIRGTLAVFGLILMAKSGSRGQFFGSLIAVFACLPIARSIKRPAAWATLIILTAMVAIIFAYFATGTRWDFTRMTNTYQGTRLDTAATVINAWTSAGGLRIFLGLGTCASFSPSIIGFYPHFVPLEILAEEGVIGFLIFLGILYCSFLAAVRLFRACADYPDARGVLAVITAFVVFALILCMKQGSMIGSPWLFASIIILGQAELGWRVVVRDVQSRRTGAVLPASRALPV